MEIPWLWIESVSIINVSIIPKLVCKIQYDSTQNPRRIFEVLRSRIAMTHEEGNQVEACVLQDTRPCKVQAIKEV